MDFLKENLFYVVLAVAVLVISVPCYVFGTARAEQVRRGQQQASMTITQLSRRVASIKKVSPDAMTRAGTFQQEHQAQRDKVLAQLKRADRRMDYLFLVDPEKPGGVPSAEKYRDAYARAYAELLKQIENAGLKSTEKSPLPPKADWGSARPSEFAIRVSQKKYWILKALVDILTDPKCGVRSVQDIALDIDPSDANGYNRISPSGHYWIYPMRIEFRIDFRTFPVFLEKLVSREDVFFHPPGVWFMNRAFDETKEVYAPTVSVSFDCDVWDYVSTPFEKSNATKYKKRPAGGTGRGGRR